MTTIDDIHGLLIAQGQVIDQGLDGVRASIEGLRGEVSIHGRSIAAIEERCKNRGEELRDMRHDLCALRESTGQYKIRVAELGGRGMAKREIIAWITAVTAIIGAAVVLYNALSGG